MSRFADVSPDWLYWLHLLVGGLNTRSGRPFQIHTCLSSLFVTADLEWKAAVISAVCADKRDRKCSALQAERSVFWH